MKTNKHILWFVGIFILLTFLPTSCKQEEDKIVHVSKNINTTTYKIAVVLPLSQNSLYKKRLENTVDWALENMRNAQKYLTQTDDTLAIDLAIEWHDEDKEDLKALATTLSNREDIMLTVGPLRNENVEIMAKAYKKAIPLATAQTENWISLS